MDSQRQIVFVTGEPGIGKTSLVEEFQRRAAEAIPLRLAAGQCVEGYGGKEPYYPVLNALGLLSRDSDVVDVLATHAPTWLVQFPSLVRQDQREILQREIVGATGQRMLREIGVALQDFVVGQATAPRHRGPAPGRPLHHRSDFHLGKEPCACQADGDRHLLSGGRNTLRSPPKIRRAGSAGPPALLSPRRRPSSGARNRPTPCRSDSPENPMSRKVSRPYSCASPKGIRLSCSLPWSTSNSAASS